MRPRAQINANGMSANVALYIVLYYNNLRTISIHNILTIKIFVIFGIDYLDGFGVFNFLTKFIQCP